LTQIDFTDFFIKVALLRNAGLACVTLAGARPGKNKIKILEAEVGVVNWKLETKLALKDVRVGGGD